MRSAFAVVVLALGLAHGAPVSATAADALLAAARDGDLAAVEAALAAGAAVDTRDDRGRTALLVATVHDHPAVARRLIEAGADVDASDHQRDTPFLYAGAEGRIEILRMTLAAGADLASTNRYGGTALIPAAHHGHVDAVRMLLDTAIDVDHVNRLGWTALLEAIILGDGGPTHTEIVRLLLAGGADPDLADGDGVRPLAHAQSRGYRPIAALLEAAGARP
ncbi:MAG: ankyrin repeat domain-containing protein [Ectothiorhodospiraceae bacterium]|nr:ankyrin repeat domain-containing protein [Ectothiorhodospiraceae bacterium]